MQKIRVDQQDYFLHKYERLVGERSFPLFLLRWLFLSSLGLLTEAKRLVAHYPLNSSSQIVLL